MTMLPISFFTLKVEQDGHWGWLFWTYSTVQSCNVEHFKNGTKATVALNVKQRSQQIPEHKLL